MAGTATDHVSEELMCSLDTILGDETTVSIGGPVDAGHAPRARSFLRAVLDLGLTSITVDLRHVTAIDAAGLGVLVATSRAAERAGGQLVLIGARRQVAQVLALVGLPVGRDSGALGALAGRQQPAPTPPGPTWRRVLEIPKER